MKQKHIYMSVLTILLALFSFSCQDEEPTPTIDMDNEIVFFNGNIYTVNTDLPWAEAVYVKDGVIEFVGTTEKAKEKK